MVGGTVIGLTRGHENTLVYVQGSGCERNDTLSIRVIERRMDIDTPVTIREGDFVWWQGDWAMWTPGGTAHHQAPNECGRSWDIRLRRVGYSH